MTLLLLILLTTMTQHELIEHYRARGEKLIAKRGEKLVIEQTFDNELNRSDSATLAALGEQTNLPPRMDRSGDIITISGGELENFRRNPQYLWMHGKTIEPVHTIGRIVRIVRTENILFALAEYAPEGSSALADKVYALDKAGLLPANSIGFHPIEWKPNEHGGITFTKWELIEISKVELPANAAAVDE
jgi:HK97 family phage prohead protease